MSRVARARQRVLEAQASSRLEAARPLGFTDGADAAASPEVQEPWDLFDAPAEEQDAALTLERLPDAELDGLGPAVREQLAAVVRRVFFPPPAGIGARSLLLCAVGECLPSMTTARQIASLLAFAQRGRRVCLQEVTAESPVPSRWLRQLFTRFDYVILGAGQASPAERNAVAGHVDGVIVLVDERATRRDVARRVTDELEACGARLLGVIVTNRFDPIPGALYRRL